MSKQYWFVFIVTLSGIVVLILVGTLYRFYSCLTHNNQITIVTDPNFSAAGAVLIKKTLLHELSLHRRSQDLFSSMKHQFHCIDSIEVTLYAPQRIEYKINALLPRYKVNQRFTLASNNMLMSQDWYTKHLLATLPTIMAEQPLAAGAAPQGLCALAAKLTKSILSEYETTWHDETTTTLLHKTIPEFRIVCNAHCIDKDLLYTQCKKIYEHLLSTTTLAKHYILALQADVRFANQIVIHSEKKRMAHG